MSVSLNAWIDLTKHSSSPEESLEFRENLEAAITQYEIGETVWAGMLADGSAVDVTIETEDEEHARLFLEDYLGHCGVYQDTKVTLEEPTSE